jgi:FtsZ-binding cell division protein ZapB
MATAEPLTYDIETGDAESLAMAGVNLPPEPELKGPLKPVAETTPKECITGVIAGGSVVTSLVAIILEQSIVVILAGVLSGVMGPYAYYQQTKLTDISTLKETAVVIQREVDRLKHENDRLADNVDELGNTIDNLQDVEEALDYITKTQAQSVSGLEQQVEENKHILSKMKKNTKGQVIQNLISIIYRGDVNGDGMIGVEEVAELIKGLNNIGGLTVHEDKLKIAITGMKTDAIIDVVKNLLSEDVLPRERIFEIEEAQQ